MKRTRISRRRFFMHRKIFWIVLFYTLLTCSKAFAQLEWRVSVKFILDATGQRCKLKCDPLSCTLQTESAVQRFFDTTNVLLDSYGRGYRFTVIEIVDLPGVSQWFDSNPDARAALEVAALKDKVLYKWRDDAINIYFTCGCCGADARQPPAALFLYSRCVNTLTNMLHELDHYFDLCHTMGCSCAIDCADTLCLADAHCHACPHDDQIEDTIEDLVCWDSTDIAAYHFGVPFASLNSEQQDSVLDVFRNIMSYHVPQDRLTEDQLDHMTCVSNSSRSAVTTGRTRIVGYKMSGEEECGDLTYKYSTFSSALTAADVGDIILFRSGTYTFTGIVSKPITLRSSRGSTLLWSTPSQLVTENKKSR